MSISSEEAEPWTGTQRALPILGGILWLLVGVVVIALGILRTEHWWSFAAWGVFIALVGLFALYVRFSILPTVRP